MVLVGFPPSAKLHEHFLVSFLMFFLLSLYYTGRYYKYSFACNIVLKYFNRFNESTTHRISTIHH